MSACGRLRPTECFAVGCHPACCIRPKEFWRFLKISAFCCSSDSQKWGFWGLCQVSLILANQSFTIVVGKS